MKLIVDADPLLHKLAGNTTQDFEDSEAITDAFDFKNIKKAFKRELQFIRDIFDVECALTEQKAGRIKLAISDSAANGFRRAIHPGYKSKRKSRGEAFEQLRQWVIDRPETVFVKTAEADDIVAYYVRRGYIGWTIDKDLLYGVPGRWYDAYHMQWLTTTTIQARKFCLEQSLAGDATDEIPGLPRVGHATAKKLLDEFGWNWIGVVAAYESKGFTEKDAILTRQLIGMDALKKRNGKWVIEPFKGV